MRSPHTASSVGSSEAPPQGPPTGPVPRSTALRAAAVLAVPSLALLLLVATSWGPLMRLDDRVATTTHRWALAEDGLTRTFRILTDWVWDPATMRILVGVVVVWLVWRRAAWWLASWLVLTCALATVVQQGMKAAMGRERPVWTDPVDTAHYAAFPSGHAMTATVVLGLMLWLLRLYGVGRVLWRIALVVAAVSVLGVGLTRIWLGVHWASDVVGGWLLGATTVALAVAAYEKWRPGGRS